MSAVAKRNCLECLIATAILFGCQHPTQQLSDTDPPRAQLRIAYVDMTNGELASNRPVVEPFLYDPTDCGHRIKLKAIGLDSPKLDMPFRGIHDGGEQFTELYIPSDKPIAIGFRTSFILGPTKTLYCEGAVTFTPKANAMYLVQHHISDQAPLCKNYLLQIVRQQDTYIPAIEPSARNLDTSCLGDSAQLVESVWRLAYGNAF
jgi:hypothetical protein